MPLDRLCACVCVCVCCKTCVKAARICCLLTVAEVPTIQANSFAFFLPQSLQISSDIHQSPNSPTKIHHTADRLSRSGNRVAWWRRYFGPLRPELVSEELLNEFTSVNPTLDLSSIILVKSSFALLGAWALHDSSQLRLHKFPRKCSLILRILTSKIMEKCGWHGWHALILDLHESWWNWEGNIMAAFQFQNIPKSCSAGPMISVQKATVNSRTWPAVVRNCQIQNDTR